jgi:hypothetical protein
MVADALVLPEARHFRIALLREEPETAVRVVPEIELH